MSTVIQVFGWAATVLGFGVSTAALRESYTVRAKHSTGPLDPNPFLMQFVNQMAWGAYGVRMKSVPMYFYYSYGLACCLVFFVVYGRACTAEAWPSYRNRLLASVFFAAVAVVVACTLALGVLGWYGTVASILVYFLPFRCIYLTRSTACISVMLNTTGLISGFCWAVYGLGRGDLYLGWASAFCCVLTLVLVCMWVVEFKLHPRPTSAQRRE